MLNILDKNFQYEEPWGVQLPPTGQFLKLTAKGLERVTV